MISFVDLVRPSNKARAFCYDLMCVITGSLFLALMAQLTLPLWFSPVPISMQSFAVLMLGAVLGSKRGALAVLTYLAQGACGLPFFAGGSFGFAVLMGACGGYLFGYVFAAFLIGYLLERGWNTSYKYTVSALTLGTFVILVAGFAWLSLFVGVHNACVMGVYPFLIGDLLKVGIATSLISTGWKLLK